MGSNLFVVLTQRRRSQGKRFSDVYDARKEFRPKTDMTRWDISDIKIRDLILLELRISRFRLKSDEEQKSAQTSNTKYRPRPTGWDTWRAQYEFQSISLLKVDETVQKKEDDADVCI